MKSFLFVMVVMMVTLTSAQASPNTDLARAKNCLACHAIDHKVIGPSYQDIAKKFAGQKGAEAKLVQRVRQGSAGEWGDPSASVMPANTQVTEAEAHTLVKWILGGAK